MNIYMMKKPKRINSVSVTMAIGILVIVYLVYWWGPILWPLFRMTGIMKAACNDAYRITDNEAVMKKLVADAQRTGLRITKDNFRFRRLPYTAADLKALNPNGDADMSYTEKRGKHCEIDFRYSDDFPIPFTGKTMRFTFDRTVDQSLELVKYDKICTCVTVGGGARALSTGAPVDR